ncbi:hypothetical protein [Microbulbifer taiwanensis]|uniref:hypothetical protein n=1 Tax=Microbulbifer taiwanensis TaxID=986746 RepID=UPI003611C6FD
MDAVTLKKLKSEERWLLWKTIDGKKIPYYTNGDPRGRIGNKEIKIDSPEDHDRLVDFKTAQKSYRDSKGKYSGIGLAIFKPLIGIDLDKCYTEDGELIPQAANIVERAGSYTEKSPSGKGVHILCFGYPGGHTKKPTHDGYEYEFYSGGRFFTFTGEHDKASPPDLKWVDLNKFPELYPNREQPLPGARGSGSLRTTTPRKTTTERNGRFK